MKRPLLFAFLAAVSGNAFACGCAPTTLAERYAKASIVFVGSTRSDPSKPGKFGGTVSFQISRSLKGGLAAGSKVAIDPLFGTDCAAPFIAGAQFLVFAFTWPKHTPIVSACSIHATEPVSVDGQTLQPEPEVIEFLQSH